MILKKAGVMFVLVLGIAVAACGGGKGEAKGSADAKVDVAPMDQLKGLSVDLQGQLDALMSPINEIDALVEQITSMPKRLNVNAKDLMAMCKVSLDGGQVQLSAEMNADAMVKAEVEGVLAKLKGIADGLKAIPQNTQALAAKAAAALVQVPALGAQVTGSASPRRRRRRRPTSSRSRRCRPTCRRRSKTCRRR
jgi:hypothetical protein